MKPHMHELDLLWTQELYREWQELQVYYRLQLPKPLIQVSDDHSRYGTYDPLIHKLTISRLLIQNYSWDVVIEVFKHEIAHMLVFLRHSQTTEAPHGPLFQEACDRLGVAPWARHATIEVDPAQAMQAHRVLREEEERLLRKVEKLLSLASSNEAHEATLAMQRARELIMRYQLEKHLARRTNDYTYVLIEHKKKQISAHQSAIASILCTHFFVDCVTRSLYDAKDVCHYKVLEIIGTRENVQMAEYVYWFLWNQLPFLWRRHQAEHRTARGKLSQRSFFLGVLHGFRQKLTLQKEDIRQQAETWGLQLSSEQCLDLTGRSQRDLRAFLRQRYPYLERRSREGSRVTRDDFAQGEERGRELNLHRGLAQETKGRMALLPGASSRS
jgi:predicted SprT family Zn-dependent metalloprotease